MEVLLGASGRVVVELRQVPRVTIALEAIVSAVDCPWDSLQNVTGVPGRRIERGWLANDANHEVCQLLILVAYL